MLGVGVLGVIVFFFVIRPLQIRSQKQSFDKAEASLDTLATQIQEKIGEADEVKKEESCGRANLKSEEGPLICSTRAYLLYRNTDSLVSSRFMTTLSKDNSSSLRIGSGSAKDKSFIPITSQRGEQTFFQDFSNDTEPNCSYTYSYPATDREFAVTGENFEVGMICGGPALKEYYPLKD